MFDRHRIRRWRIGHEEQLARLTRDDLWAYYRSRYVPERTIVAIVGAVDPDRALALARAGVRRLAGGRRRGGPLARGARRAARSAPARSGATSPRRSWCSAGARCRRCIPTHRRWISRPRCSARGGEAGSTASLREPGIVTWVGRAQLRADRAGRLQRRAPSCGRSGSTRRSSGIAEAISRLALRGAQPPTSWIGPARWCARAGPAGSSPWRGGRARSPRRRRWTTSRCSTGSTRCSPRSDRHEVREAAARHLQPGRRGGRGLPAADGGRDLTADSPGPHLRGHRAARRGRTASRRGRRAGRAMPARPAQEHGVSVTRLPGADLLVYRKAGVPLVNLGIYVPRRRFDPPAQAGLGSLLVRAAVRGAGDLDAAALAFAFERLGGTLAHQLRLRLARLRRLGAVARTCPKRRRCSMPSSPSRT